MAQVLPQIISRGPQLSPWPEWLQESFLGRELWLGSLDRLRMPGAARSGRECGILVTFRI